MPPGVNVCVPRLLREPPFIEATGCSRTGGPTPCMSRGSSESRLSLRIRPGSHRHDDQHPPPRPPPGAAFHLRRPQGRRSRGPSLHYCRCGVRRDGRRRTRFAGRRARAVAPHVGRRDSRLVHHRSGLSELLLGADTPSAPSSPGVLLWLTAVALVAAGAPVQRRTLRLGSRQLRRPGRGTCSRSWRRQRLVPDAVFPTWSLPDAGPSAAGCAWARPLPPVRPEVLARVRPPRAGSARTGPAGRSR